MNLDHPTGDNLDAQRLREADDTGDQSHDYDPIGRAPTQDEVRRRRALAQRVENALIGLDTPRTPFVPRDEDVLPEARYEANGPDDVQIIS